MFTRPLFETADLIEQHKLLTGMARLVEAGELRTTLSEHFGRTNSTNLNRATRSWKPAGREKARAGRASERR
jgi:hypothetical protein